MKSLKLQTPKELQEAIKRKRLRTVARLKKIQDNAKELLEKEG